MTLKAQVRHVHVVKAGVSVGYERSWVADRDCTIATLAIGFADGLERDLSNAVWSRDQCGTDQYNNFRNWYLVATLPFYFSPNAVS